VADRSGLQKARLAGADHSGDRRRLRHRGRAAPSGGVEAVRLALAGAVHDHGRRRPAARPDAAVAHPAVAQGRGRGGRDADRGRGAARRGHPLDGAGDAAASGSASARCRASGGHTVCGRIRSGLSSSRPTPTSPRRSRTSSPCMSIRRPMPWCGRSTRSFPGFQGRPWWSARSGKRSRRLDRTQPGVPMMKGRAGTMTHDYNRHGTTTLFATLECSTGGSSGAAWCATITRRSSAS
jgi:hypothetical protein